MRTAAFTLLAALLAVAGCGVKRPLIRPADVPAYEKERARHRAELEDNSPNPFAAEEGEPVEPAPIAPPAETPGR